MNSFEQKYLNLSLERLEKFLPCSKEELLETYERQEAEGSFLSYQVEQLPQHRISVIFTFEEIPQILERAVLLVYDETDQIISDTSCYLCTMDAFMKEQRIYDQLSEDSDWMYLEHYVLCGSVFDTLPYPLCLQKDAHTYAFDGEVIAYTNAYVTKAFRQQGLFKTMLDEMKDFVLRKAEKDTYIYTVIALDPDVACYGPDTQKEPYYYQYEKDEPVRVLNGKILESLGFEVIQLIEDEPDENSDGTKIWFAYSKELNVFLEREKEA